MLKRLFTEHPASVNETYGEHLQVAASFGWHMLWASLACFVHAVLPFCFEKTASRAITDLHERMVTHRTRRAPTTAPAFMSRTTLSSQRG